MDPSKADVERVAAAIAEASAAGSSVAARDEEARRGMAALALRRWGSFERRSKSNRKGFDDRVEDLHSADMRRRRLVPLLLLPALVGCGGGDDAPATAGGATASASATPSAFDLAAFQQQAETICADMLATLPADEPDAPEEFVPALKATLSALADAEPGFAALSYPSTPEGQQVRTVFTDYFPQFRRDAEAIVGELVAAEKAKDAVAFRTAASKLIALGERPLDPEGVLAPNGLPQCDEALSALSVD